MASKTRFGADLEADEILEELPKKGQSKGFDQEYGYPRTEPNAWIYRDAAGRLCILPVTGGWLDIEEQDLIYVHGDLAPFSD